MDKYQEIYPPPSFSLVKESLKYKFCKKTKYPTFLSQKLIQTAKNEICIEQDLIFEFEKSTKNTSLGKKNVRKKGI